MKQTSGMNVFERYLSLWVAACMVLGVAIGKLAYAGGFAADVTDVDVDRDVLLALEELEDEAEEG